MSTPKTSSGKMLSIVNSLYNDNTAGLGGNNDNVLTINYENVSSFTDFTYILFTSENGTGTDTHINPNNATATSVTCGYPGSMKPGSYDIQIMNSAGDAVCANSLKLNIYAPSVHSFDKSGNVAGGTPFTIKGKYLEGATNVLFGETGASGFNVDKNSATEIKFASPPEAAVTPNNGAKKSNPDVFVQIPGGSSPWKIGSFSYVDPNFTVTGYYPNYAASVGKKIAVYGTNLNSKSVANIEIWDVSRETLIATIQSDDLTFGDESSVGFNVPEGLAVNTDYNIAIAASNNGGTVFVSDFTPGNPMLSFVAAAKIAASTVLNSGLSNDSGSLSVASLLQNEELTVYSTSDFTDSGDLFLQTTKGVAILAYTGVDVNTSTLENGYYTGKFKGVQQYTTIPEKYLGLGDFDTSTSGLVLKNYASIFQASDSCGFSLDINCNAAGTSEMEYLAYYNTAVPSGSTPTFYILDINSGSGKWKTAPNQQPVATQVLNNGTNTIKLPLMPTNSANFIFTKGAYSPAISTVNGGVPRPRPFTHEQTNNSNIYDFVEFTLDGTAGDSNVTLGTRLLPKLTIDTTQVDQLGLPIQISASKASVVPIKIDNTTTTIDEVGVNPALSMSQIYSDYADFLGTDSDWSSTLLLESGQTGAYLRIANPGAVLTEGADSNTNKLNWVFDKVLYDLFTAPTGGKITLFTGDAGNLSNATFTGVATTVTQSSNTYKVLQFSSSENPDFGSLNVYMPLFKNNKTGAPAANQSYYQSVDAPSWLGSPPATSGVMVLSNSGVFADSGAQPNLSPEQQAVLGNIEDQLVAAINRGCALQPTGDQKNTTYWQDPKNHYPSGELANKYGEFLHTYTASGNTIFFGLTTPFKYGLSYALAYDDQGSLSTTMTVINDFTSTSISISQL